jgi:hypothetical protein
MSRSEALKHVDDVCAEYGLAVQPYIAGTTYNPSIASCSNYPNPAEIMKSYTADGTPVVTYYCPPPAYYTMYAWVPSPFWWSDLWFPGFFILNDFHRVVRHHDRVVVIRNHFNDVRHNRAFRVDPRERFRGRTYGGIGVPRNRDVISTGVPRGERVIFNSPRPDRSPVSSSGGRTAPIIRREEKSMPRSGDDGPFTPRSGRERGEFPSGGGFIERQRVR